MWILPFTFLICFGLVVRVYWFAVVRPESQTRDRVTERLQTPTVVREEVAQLINETPRSSTIPAVDTLLTRAGAMTERTQLLIDAADVRTTVSRLVLGSLLVGVATYVLIGVVFGLVGLGFICALIAGSLPYLYVRRRRTVRFKQFEEQFPEAIDLIARAMRAGHGLSAGLGMVAEELPQPVGREFRLLYDWQNFGMSLPDALHRFAGRVPLLDARFFVTAVLTQRESGGNLAEVLDNLSRVIRERFRVKRQIRVLSAHGRVTGAVLSAMPPAMALFFFISKPDYIKELANDPLGMRMVVGALLMQIVGMLIIRRLVDIEY